MSVSKTATLSEAEYIAQALAAMESVRNDHELVQWDDTWAGGTEAYMSLSDAGAKKLDDAYREKLGWICGMGAG